MTKNVSNSEDSSAALMESDDKVRANGSESRKGTSYGSIMFKNDADDNIFVETTMNNLTSQNVQNRLETDQKKHIVLRDVDKIHLIDVTSNKSSENANEKRHASCEQHYSFISSMARVGNVTEKVFFEPISRNTRQLYRSTSEESLHSKFYDYSLTSNRDACTMRQILFINENYLEAKSNLLTQNSCTEEPSHIQIQKLMDIIKEKDIHIVHLNQQHDQIRVAQLCVLQQIKRIVSQIIKLKQQSSIEKDDIEQIKEELVFISQCFDNAEFSGEIVKPDITLTVDPYYRSIFENMDTPMQMEFQSIDYILADKTVENQNQILKNRLQQHIHEVDIRTKHKLLNGLNLNEQKIEEDSQIKSEVDTNDKINQLNEEAQLKLTYSLRTNTIDAPCTAAEAITSDSALEALNQWLETLTAESRVAWALRELSGAYVLSSSFGAQAAVSLHLLTTQKPNIPVLLVDTGYLFPETYNFIDELRKRLQLNLHVLRPEISATWFEARHGRLWEQGVDGIGIYNYLMKLKPMQLALDKLRVKTWFAGLRRNQCESRKQIRIIERQNGRWKVHPIADWTDRDVGMYLRRHNLPYHPLWEKGYVSIGDVHTTRPWESGLRQEDTRFFGLNRECGLHKHI